MNRIRYSSRGRSRGPITLGGRIFVSIFFLVFATAGVALAILLARQQLESLKTRWWPSMPCSIVGGKISSKAPYTCTLVYDYSVNGKPYRGTVIYPGYDGSDDYYDAQKIRDDYPNGQNTVCRVNPADPTEAALRSQSLWNLLQLLFPMVFITIGVGGIIFAWRPARPRSGPVVMRHPKFVMAMIFSAVLFAGLIMLGFLISMLLHWRAAQSWPGVACNIVRSSVGSHTSHSKHGSSTTYSVEVFYRYTFDGKRHASSRYQLVDESDSDYSGKRAISENLNQNRKQTCYVDPTDPDYAVLDRSFSAAMLILGGMAAASLLAGGAGLKFVANAVRQEHRKLLEEQLSPSQRGPTLLHASSSRLAQIFPLFAMALFWNGLVSVFVVVIVQDARAGNPNWPMIVFISVFVLIGVLIFVQAILQCRVLFYPSADITLSRHPLAPGEQADLKWDLVGQSDRITRLRICVCGFEIPVDQVGYPHLNNFSPVWSLDLIDTTSVIDIRAGHRKFSIPPDALPPRENKQPFWAIILTADLGKPPQLRQEFPVHVLRSP